MHAIMLKSRFIYKCHYAQVKVYILMSLWSNQGFYINVIILKSMFIYKCHYAQVNVYI